MTTHVDPGSDLMIRRRGYKLAYDARCHAERELGQAEASLGRAVAAAYLGDDEPHDTKLTASVRVAEGRLREAEAELRRATLAALTLRQGIR